MSVRPVMPLLQRPLYRGSFIQGMRSISSKPISFTNFPKNPSQSRPLSQSTRVNPENHTVNKMGKLGAGLIFGGSFLTALYFAHKNGYLNFPEAKFSSAQDLDDIALKRYFELLLCYPKLKREDELNDHKMGTYEIIYDPKTISEVRKEIYERLYNKAKAQGLTHVQADETATSCSRPGVVCEDQFWIWIRDVVISPQGFKHTYNRIVMKSDLDRIGGAAALPIIVENGIKKIVLQLAFRHATNSWEMEISRGGSKANESSLDTAKREIREETGYETDNLVSLGSISPDSGLTASIVPIYLGKVTVDKGTKHDKTEAIKGKYAFTLAEIMAGLKLGYMEVDINGKMTQVPMRDPFLAYALLMAQNDGHL